MHLSAKERNFTHKMKKKCLVVDLKKLVGKSFSLQM